MHTGVMRSLHLHRAMHDTDMNAMRMQNPCSKPHGNTSSE